MRPSPLHPESPLFLIILSALMAFTSLSTDIYLPALPAMEAALHGDAELTITGFVAGFALGQLFWGPVADRTGRKLPLYIGIVLFVIGSVGCAMADSMQTLVLWRFFQALGACVGPMLSRTMIRDLYGPQEAAQMLSTLVMAMAVAPIVGPMLGGLLLKVSGWEANFWLLTGIGPLMFFAVCRLPETLPAERREGGPLGKTFLGYWPLLHNRTFVRYTLCVTFFYMAIYAFIAGSPYVYITYFGIDSSWYGPLFGVNILGVVALSAINRRLLRRHTLAWMLRISTRIAALAGLCPAALAATGTGGIWGVALPVFVVFSMNGIIAACCNAASLASVEGSRAGSAAALMGAMQYGSGMVSTPLLALFSDGTPRTMAVIIAVFVVLSALMVQGKGEEKASAVV